jgi:LPS export ABC transporter protein LptC
MRSSVPARPSRRAGGILAWLLLVLVGAGAWYAYKRGPAIVKPARVDDVPTDRIEMKDVRIEVFDERFKQTSELRGRTATSFKSSSDLVLEPADCLLLRDHGKNVQITAARGHKVVTRGQPDRLEFTGAVNVDSEGRKLISEKLVYWPHSRLLESAAPVQIITTGSVVSAQHLKTQTDLKTGTLDGKVEITSLGDGGRRSLDVPVLVRGRKADFDLSRGIYDVTGDAWAKKADQEVRSDKMAFNRGRNTLTAIGNAVATRPDLTVTAGRLEYWVDREAGLAIDGPKAVQRTPRTTNEGESKTELTAKQLEMDFKRSILEGKEDVHLQRDVMYEGDWDKDYEIKAKFVTSLYAQGRSTFRDDVKIDATQVGATGQRAIFYQKTGKLYVIGDANAWEYDEDKQKMNPIRGEKILHDLKSGKSQVLGRVEGLMQEGGPPRKRNTGPGGRRPGRVEIKYNEGGGDQ